MEDPVAQCLTLNIHDVHDRAPRGRLVNGGHGPPYAIRRYIRTEITMLRCRRHARLAKVHFADNVWSAACSTHGTLCRSDDAGASWRRDEQT